MVSRPLAITVQATALDGSGTSTDDDRVLARLIAHEIDHLDGLLHTARMRPGVQPIPVEEYRRGLKVRVTLAELARTGHWCQDAEVRPAVVPVRNGVKCAGERSMGRSGRQAVRI
ncbi:peptide deformylase [Streptomyces sp. NBC_00873]|nr:peptide deformylase [Streptomyces sp. NBC_00873]WTA49042.1 peptide deformylase [Streptomyces sp. NBC_00842]